MKKSTHPQINIRKKIFSLTCCVIYFFLLFAIPPVFASQNRLYPNNNRLFSTPPRLKPQVDFWIKIYSKYTTQEVVIHDDKYLDIVYEVIDFNEIFKKKKRSERQKRKKVKAVKKKYRNLVKKIVSKKVNHTKLSKRERQMYQMLVLRYPKKQLRFAYKHIRGQIGQKDRFKKGLKISGRYIKKMKAIFQSYNLPVELTVLPHVESSFNIKAYSRFGAAGIWQFTRSTGRRFLKINYEVDDRRDPIFATVAAAKLLKYNYNGLKVWPLAITAYNHGFWGMKRAQKKIGSDINDIIDKYKGRTFGFASRNFYSEFLAALHVVRYYEKYFGSILLDKKFEYTTIQLEDFLDIKTISNYLGLKKEIIALYNPSLRPNVFGSHKYLPKGYNLRIPVEKLNQIIAAYKKIPEEKRFARQKRSQWYKVRRGDSLSTVARRMRTSVESLRSFNNIRNSHRIYIGQILKVPGTLKVKNDTYRVKKGDSISEISARFRVNPSTLKKVNRILDIDSIKPGQILTIPVKGDKKKGLVQKKEVKQQKVVTYPDKKVIPQIQQGKQEQNILVNTLPTRDFAPISIGSSSVKNNYLWVEVLPDETLGHFSDWSKLPTWKLRRLNNLSFREIIKIGQKVKVSFDKTTSGNFETLRREYHKGIEEDFFDNFLIEKIDSYVLKRGDTLWDICKENNIPYWLLKGYNADKKLTTLIAGDVLTLPVVSKVTSR